MIGPGTRMRTLTPRASARSSATIDSSSGTKYGVARSIEREAAVIDRRYMSCMLSAPASGELENICARASPAGAIGGK